MSKLQPPNNSSAGGCREILNELMGVHEGTVHLVEEHQWLLSLP